MCVALPRIPKSSRRGKERPHLNRLKKRPQMLGTRSRKRLLMWLRKLKRVPPMFKEELLKSMMMSRIRLRKRLRSMEMRQGRQERPERKRRSFMERDLRGT